MDEPRARLAHRPDIDGLRGVAVLAVVLYHLGFKHVSGGYVGVDVFFVISGYLITAIVLKEFDRRTFSIAGFYERRIRRIFPALFLVLAISMAAAASLFRPANFAAMGRAAVAVTMFASNFLFWRQSGYFDAPAEHNPLLHTWSLGVEEQFYIAWPLVLLAIRRFGRSRFTLWLSIGAAVSLAVAVYATRRTPVAAFYLAPARAWELMIGAILASARLRADHGLLARNVIATIGLAFIVASAVLFDAATPFPGLAALLPTIGAALLVYVGTGGGSGVTRLLSVRPVAFLGLISYSLYLIHWPLIVFAKLVVIRDMTLGLTMALLAASVLLAFISWRYVERPCRSISLARGRVFAVAGTVMATSIVAGTAVVKGGPADPATAAERRWAACDDRRPDQAQGLCALGAPAAPSFLLWGDSHAGALAQGVGLSAMRHGAAGYVATKAGCPPLVGVRVDWANQPAMSCEAFNDEVLRYLGEQPDLKTVVLAARWGMFAVGRGYHVDAALKVTLTNHGSADGGAGDDAFRSAFARTVRTLRAMHRDVLIVEPIPEVGYDVPDALYIGRRTGRDVTRIIAPTIEEYEERNRLVFAAFEQIDDLETIAIAARMCGDTQCMVTDRHGSLYVDAHHLSENGSRYLSSLFDAVFIPNFASEAGIRTASRRVP